MDRLSDDVTRELGRFGPAGAMAEIVEAWPGLVGTQIAANAWPARVTRDGTLVVNAADSIWAFELGQQAEEIHARLGERLGEKAPKSLKFIPGHLPEPAVPDQAPARQTPPSPTVEEQEVAAKLASVIDDVELRDRVQRAAALSLAAAAAGRRF